MRLLSLSLLTALSLSACGGLPTPLSNSSQSAAAVRSAPTEVVVDGKTLSLEATAWTSNSGGINSNPFIIAVRISSSDGAVPAGVVPQRLYLVRGEQVWESGFTNEYRGPSAVPSERVARTSNRFPEGTTLNFAVDLVTPQGVQLLRMAGDQVIASPQ